MDFKVTYLDGGLNSLAANDRSGLLSDSDFVLRCQRTRRYKSQIRDIITTCRKRKSPSNLAPNLSSPPVTPLIPADPYVEDPGVYNPVYPYPDGNINGAPTYQQNLMFDNSRLVAENFLHYRPLGTYYPDYTVTQYPTTNGFLDRTCFATFQPDKEDKLYQQCQMEASSPRTSNCESYMNGQQQPLILDPPPEIKVCSSSSGNLPSFPPPSLDYGVSKSSKINGGGSSILMALRDWHKDDKVFDTRQSVLMWNNNNNSNGLNNGLSVDCPGGLPTYDLKRDARQDLGCKWSGHAAAPKSASPHNSTSPASGKVAPQVTYGSTPYTQDMRLEVRMETTNFN